MMEGVGEGLAAERQNTHVYGVTELAALVQSSTSSGYADHAQTTRRLTEMLLAFVMTLG